MASQLEALILRGPLPGLPPVVHPRSLGHGLNLLPVTEHVVDWASATYPAGQVAWLGDLRTCVAQWAVELSAGRKVLYACSETTAGESRQSAIAWQDGLVIFGPALTCDLAIDADVWFTVSSLRDRAVNAGLRALGVKAGDAVDEFAAAGLERHRFTQDWVDEDPLLPA